MSGASRTGRLSTLAAALVVARRDFVAILFSRSFLFFLLGPLFTLGVGVLAGGIGQSVQESAGRPVLGVAMSAADTDAFMASAKRLNVQLDGIVPDLEVVRRLEPNERFDPALALKGNGANLAAIVSGDLRHPVLTGSEAWISRWQSQVALVAGDALERAPASYPKVQLTQTVATNADQKRSRLATAQFGQVTLFMMMMFLAGMVMSNLVEEKSNKIIEVLAAAIPMDAVFLGKLFAMLAVSLVGIAVWGGFGVPIWLASGKSLASYAAPAVGWGTFGVLAVIYFALGYLVLGSIFLTIGAMASTVREVQTLSMPVTMLQLVNFFFANFAMAQPGTWIEKAAMIVPFSSPFAMLAHAAQSSDMWPHVLAIAWQMVCVSVLVRMGATLFRKRVMQSGPQRARRSWWRRGTAANA